MNKTEKSAMPPWWGSQPKKKGKGKGKGPRELERIVSQFIDERLVRHGPEKATGC